MSKTRGGLPEKAKAHRAGQWPPIAKSLTNKQYICDGSGPVQRMVYHERKQGARYRGRPGLRQRRCVGYNYSDPVHRSTCTMVVLIFNS